MPEPNLATHGFYKEFSKEDFDEYLSDYRKGSKAALYEALAACIEVGVLHQDNTTRKFGYNGVVVPGALMIEALDLLRSYMEKDKEWVEEYVLAGKKKNRHDFVKRYRKFSFLLKDFDRDQLVAVKLAENHTAVVKPGYRWEDTEDDNVYEKSAKELEAGGVEVVTPRTVKQSYQDVKKELKETPWMHRDHHFICPYISKDVNGAQFQSFEKSIFEK